MKKIVSLAVGAAMLFSMATTAFAAPVARYGTGNLGYGACGGFGYSLMRDANGNFLSQEAFEANLDNAITDGYILAENRDYYVDMFDYCVANGGFGGCGGLGGRGFGRGYAR